MSKEMFTKGPWSKKAGRFGDVNLFKSQDLVATVSCETISDEMRRANATLIAVSPDMYYELKGVVMGLELLIDNSAVNALYLPALYEQVERIEALLAKARGE